MEYEGECFSVYMSHPDKSEGYSVNDAKKHCQRENRTLIQIENYQTSQFIENVIKYTSRNKLNIRSFTNQYQKRFLVPIG